VNYQHQIDYDVSFASHSPMPPHHKDVLVLLSVSGWNPTFISESWRTRAAALPRQKSLLICLHKSLKRF